MNRHRNQTTFWISWSGCIFNSTNLEEISEENWVHIFHPRKSYENLKHVGNVPKLETLISEGLTWSEVLLKQSWSSLLQYHLANNANNFPQLFYISLWIFLLQCRMFVVKSNTLVASPTGHAYMAPTRNLRHGRSCKKRNLAPSRRLYIYEAHQPMSIK